MTIVTGILETKTWIQSIKQSWTFNLCLNKFLANIILKYVVYVSTKIKSQKYGHVSTPPDLILNCQKEMRKYFFFLKIGKNMLNERVFFLLCDILFLSNCISGYRRNLPKQFKGRIKIITESTAFLFYSILFQDQQRICGKPE